MTDASDIEIQDDAPEGAAKGSKRPLLIAIALLAAMGGGGFFASFSGTVSLPFLGGASSEEVEAKEPTVREDLLGVAYLPLEELVIPLGPNARARLLLFKAEIEVAKEELPAFEAIKPRIMDMFNTYLRAIEERDLEDPSATLRLRAQLLRRLRVVASPAEPRDVLITAFVLK